MGRKADRQRVDGAVRSTEGWGELVAVGQAQEAVAGDARLLGGGEFVERLWREARRFDGYRRPAHPWRA
ncbi:MAG TPA: hypothetical protein VLT62_17045 [Candidatus Methylomirabilis sp.]|nr:hypothetical protein [Candidatus Methylomirabilis sp.]